MSTWRTGCVWSASVVGGPSLCGGFWEGERTFPALLTTERAELVLTNEPTARTALQCLTWIACYGIQYTRE